MSTGSIPRPGVEVIQEIRNVTPTIFRPTFYACVVGPHKEILEATGSSGALNSSAVMNLPASIQGDEAGTTFPVAGLYVHVVTNGVNDTEAVLPGTAPGSLPIDTIITSRLQTSSCGVRLQRTTSRFVRWGWATAYPSS